MPNSSEGSTTSQQPASICGSVSALNSSPRPCASPVRSSGVAPAQATRPRESTPTTANVQPMPATEATPPSTGPNSAPPTAVANAVPIRRPRRPGGAAATSQAIAPVHENALASPCAKRAASSCHGWSAIPNSTVHVATIVSPSNTVRFAPHRAATTPLGSAPTSAPAGYAAERIPAPALPRCSSCGVVRQQRRQRREEQRVEEHDCTRQQQ